jgi:hypothetical protein
MGQTILTPVATACQSPIGGSGSPARFHSFDAESPFFSSATTTEMFKQLEADAEETTKT